jgi:filamentous hemagglutinin family protein
MNRVYRLVWSKVASAWVAVAESARGRGKGASRKLIAAALLSAAAGAQAAPAGGQVTAGAAAITQDGLTTTIQQTSQNLSLNWQSFNVGAQETVNFVQPSASAIAINRIFDANGSQIMGRVNANGQVYLVNPNGILFGSGSQINVGGLVASTLDIQDANLNTSARTFSGSGPGRILNLGTINAASGGYVALLGNQVSNQGSVVAQLGSVVLGGGSAVTLNFNGNSLVNMVVEQSVLNSLAENGGLIKADGGRVVLSAGAKDTLLASMVNNTGDIEAHTIVRHEGKITLLGGMAAGTVNVAGTLDASAPNGGNGGFIETSAARVTVADSANISTAATNGHNGTWLIDPTDFTIAASGGDMTGAAVSAALVNNNFIVESTASTLGGSTGSGDIHVNDQVTWKANKLTLRALNNININAQLNGTESASLALEYGQGAVALNNTSDYRVNAAINLAAGDNLSTKLGSDGVTKAYTIVTELGKLTDASVAASGPLTLQGMALSTNLNKNFALGSDIDASATARSEWGTTAGFTSIGTVAGAFTGTFAGLGHTVSGLTINRPGIADIGLIGAAIGDSAIRDVGLIGGNITGGAGTGGLLGSNTTGSISNSYFTGKVSGGAGTGGLIGASTTGKISGSYAATTVTGGAGTGGLIGANTTGDISESYATGTVTGTAGTGGLLGASTTGNISDSYATGNVTGGAGTGGLLGASTTGYISNSYATGNVTGGAGSGGLVGALTTGTISNSFATGNISGTAGSGGLAGTTTGAIDSSHATGQVEGNAGSGGLVGTSTGSINLSFATGNVSGHAGSGGLAGTTTGNITTSYATGNVTGDAGSGGLAGTTTGNITTSYSTGNVTGDAGTGSLAGTTTKDIANSYTTGSANSNYGMLAGTSTVVSTDSFAVSAGDTIAFKNLSSWTLINGKPVLTSLVKEFTLTANDITQNYNGLNFSGGNGVSYSNPYQSYLTGTLSYTGSSQGARNAGTYDIVAGGLSSTNAQYVVSYKSGTLTITQAALTLSATTAAKVYDGSTSAAVVAWSDNRIDGDLLTISNSSASFSDKNAGNAKAVTVSGITLAGTDAANYSFNTTASSSANITKADAIVTANSATGVYSGQDQSVSGFTATGLVNGETSSVLTGVTAAGSGTNAGTYSIAAVGTDKNYNLALNNGSLVIDKANAIVTANSISSVYSGTTQSVNGFTATGLVNGETSSVLGDVTAAGSGTNAGTYSIAAVGSDKNYNLTLNNGSLVIASVPANSGLNTSIFSIVSPATAAASIVSITNNPGLTMPNSQYSSVAQNEQDEGGFAEPAGN